MKCPICNKDVEEEWYSDTPFIYDKPFCSKTCCRLYRKREKDKMIKESLNVS